MMQGEPANQLCRPFGVALVGLLIMSLFGHSSPLLAEDKKGAPDDGAWTTTVSGAHTTQVGTNPKQQDRDASNSGPGTAVSGSVQPEARVAEEGKQPVRAESGSDKSDSKAGTEGAITVPESKQAQSTNHRNEVPERIKIDSPTGIQPQKILGDADTKSVAVSSPAPQQTSKSADPAPSSDAPRVGGTQTQASKSPAATSDPARSAVSEERGRTVSARYCADIRQAVGSTALSKQKSQIEEAEKRIAERIELLATKTAEYKEWMERREKFTSLARENLLKIFAQMKPEAAAAQLNTMEEATAAAMILRMNPKAASAILSEMQADKAGRLSVMMAKAGDLPEKTGAPDTEAN